MRFFLHNDFIQHQLKFSTSLIIENVNLCVINIIMNKYYGIPLLRRFLESIILIYVTLFYVIDVFE